MHRRSENALIDIRNWRPPQVPHVWSRNCHEHHLLSCSDTLTRTLTLTLTLNRMLNPRTWPATVAFPHPNPHPTSNSRTQWSDADMELICLACHHEQVGSGGLTQNSLEAFGPSRSQQPMVTGGWASRRGQRHGADAKWQLPRRRRRRADTAGRGAWGRRSRCRCRAGRSGELMSVYLSRVESEWGQGRGEGWASGFGVGVRAMVCGR